MSRDDAGPCPYPTTTFLFRTLAKIPHGLKPTPPNLLLSGAPLTYSSVTPVDFRNWYLIHPAISGSCCADSVFAASAILQALVFLKELYRGNCKGVEWVIGHAVMWFGCFPDMLGCEDWRVCM